MTLGILILLDPGAGAVAPVCGLSAPGHALRQVREVLPGAPCAVVASGTPDDATRLWCGRAGATLLEAETPEVACARLGWEAALVVSGHAVFLPDGGLAAMGALARSGASRAARLGAEDGPFPMGPAARLVSPGASEDALEIPVSVPEGLPIDLRDPNAAAQAGALIDAVGRLPGAVPLRTFADAAAHTDAYPWAGPSGPLMIAEIGGNHEGDYDAAREMVRLAIGSGADCVKLQLYRGSSLVSRVESPDRHAHFKKFELIRDQHISLAEMCREAGVGYLASVWDEEMLEWIDPYMTFYKVGSGDLTALPLLDVFADRGKPILLSSGLATLDEVVQVAGHLAARDARYARPGHLCVMQCTSMYPIPDEDANLRVMDALRDATGVSVGYSDHTIGSRALVAATAMGAEVLEFHFTDRREGRTFRDHKVSLEPDEVRALRDELAAVTALRGSAAKVPQRSELETGHDLSFRRGVYPARDIRAGETIRAEDLVTLRPAHGTDVREIGRLVGATALRDLPEQAAVVEGRDYEVGPER